MHSTVDSIGEVAVAVASAEELAWAEDDIDAGLSVQFLSVFEGLREDKIVAKQQDSEWKAERFQDLLGWLVCQLRWI